MNTRRESGSTMTVEPRITLSGSGTTMARNFGGTTKVIVADDPGTTLFTRENAPSRVMGTGCDELSCEM